MFWTSVKSGPILPIFAGQLSGEFLHALRITMLVALAKKQVPFVALLSNTGREFATHFRWQGVIGHT